ncbi:MAG TPA: dihydrodipicolinate synthase family protein [Pyrinomonadaceae bacterium]|jgi:4-hydroxy-tetrahydrodipicolinate synthase
MNNKGIVEKLNKLRAAIKNGLIPAVPVPLDARAALHETGHRAYLEHMRGQPIAGVAVWAHTGRGLMLETEIADRVLRDWRAALAEKTIVAGVGARGGADFEKACAAATRMTERAARLGADAVMVYAPAWLKEKAPAPQRAALIVEYHRKIASVGLPLVLFYLYEEAGGIDYAPETLDELFSIPEVLGIKMATLDSVMTFQDVARRLKTKYPDKLLITGEDRFLGYSLMRGADAALVGMGAVCADLQAELLKAHSAGAAERFLQLSAAVDELAETLFVAPLEGYVKRVLAALVELGVIPADAAHDPWGPELAPGEFEAIGRTLAALGYKGEKACRRGF